MDHWLALYPLARVRGAYVDYLRFRHSKGVDVNPIGRASNGGASCHRLRANTLQTNQAIVVAAGAWKAGFERKSSRSNGRENSPLTDATRSIRLFPRSNRFEKRCEAQHFVVARSSVHAQSRRNIYG